MTKIIRPNVGIITNISYAHIKNFKNLDGIALAKSEIMNNIISAREKGQQSKQRASLTLTESSVLTSEVE